MRARRLQRGFFTLPGGAGAVAKAGGGGGGGGGAVVWNSADKTSGWVLSNADRTATWTSASGLHSIRATPGVLSGEKKVWCTRVTSRTSTTEHYVGVTNASQAITSIGSPYWLIRQDATVFNAGGTAAGGGFTAPAVNDYQIWGYDYTAQKLWYGLNGTWENSGDPAAGTGQVMTFTSADTFKALVQSFNNMAIDLIVPYPYSVPSGFTEL